MPLFTFPSLRYDNNHMDLGGVSLASENTEFSWIVCDHCSKRAHSWFHPTLLLQYLRLWCIGQYMMYDVLLFMATKLPLLGSSHLSNQNLHFSEMRSSIFYTHFTNTCLDHSSHYIPVYILGIYRKPSFILIYWVNELGFLFLLMFLFCLMMSAGKNFFLLPVPFHF